MNSRLVWHDAGARTFVLVLDAGEEAFRTISDFVASRGLGGASLSAIGGFERAVVGWFDLRSRSYRPVEVDQQCEGLSLLGDITLGDDGRPNLHLHAILGLPDGSVRGGHFLAGIVRPTLEVTIVEAPTQLHRRRRSDLGIALIDLSAG